MLRAFLSDDGRGAGLLVLPRYGTGAGTQPTERGTWAADGVASNRVSALGGSHLRTGALGRSRG
jgi:hypothetical protein